MAESAREGFALSESLLVAADPATRRGIESHLGTASRAVRFVDSGSLYTSPPTAVLGLLDLLSTEGSRSRLRVLATAHLDPKMHSEWVRYEAGVNEIFAGEPLTGVCFYDTRRLPQEIVRGMEQAHHGVVPPASSSSGYLDPRLVSETLPARMLHPGRHPDIVLDEVSEARPVRNTAADLAASGRAPEVAMVVHELTTLALTSNPGLLQVRIWREPGRLVAQLVGSEAFADPFAGLRPPEDEATAALWIASHLADDFAADPSGPSVTVAFSD